MPANSLDAIKDRIASDPVFAHNLLFQARHTNEPAPFHADMIRLLHGPVERVVILSFRGSAKSTLAEETLIIKALSGAYRYCVICCATVGRAQDRLRSIKNEIQNNDLIEEIFGRMEGDTWQVDRIVLASGVCIDALGCGQSTRGLKYLSERPSFALVDDLEEANLNLDNVSTPEKRQESRIGSWACFCPRFPGPRRTCPHPPCVSVERCCTPSLS